MSYQGYSTRTNNNINALTATVQANKTAADSDRALIRSELASEVSTLQTALQTEKTRAETAEASLQSALNAEIARAQAKEAELQQAVDDEATRAQAAEASLQSAVDAEVARAQAKETELETAIATEKTRAEGVEADHETRISEIETWRQTNIDELVGEEVDKAINSKVNQTAYDAVVSQLQSKDSELTQSIAQSIADSESKHEVHEDRINKSSANDVNMKAVLETVVDYLEKFSSTYVITDENDNVVADPTWSDVKAKVQAVVAHTIVQYVSLNLELRGSEEPIIYAWDPNFDVFIWDFMIGSTTWGQFSDVKLNGVALDAAQFEATNNLKVFKQHVSDGDILTFNQAGVPRTIEVYSTNRAQAHILSGTNRSLPDFDESHTVIFTREIPDLSKAVLNENGVYSVSGTERFYLVTRDSSGFIRTYGKL